jgi:hypothetical protein
LVLTASAFVLCGGCQPKSTVAGPGMLTSSGSGVSFTYLKWDSGQRILLVDNVTGGGRGSTSTSTTSDPLNHSKGYAGPDGAGYKWTCDSNATTMTFKIDGKEYDLANGSLFVIKAKDGATEVHQVKRDLNTIPYDADQCRQAIEKDEEIQKILKGAATEK